MGEMMLESLVGKTVKDVDVDSAGTMIEFTDGSSICYNDFYALQTTTPPVTSMAEVKERLEKLFPESEWNIEDRFCIQDAQEGGEITKYIKYNQAMNDYDFWVDAGNTVSFLTHPDINIAFQRFVTALNDAGVK